MSERELPSWLIGGAIAFFVLVLFGLWYHYLGPGSVPPPPVRVEEPSPDGMSSKARMLMYQRR
jgi:hypothetical protein